jgi:glycosyltransferase involved in cell wall biosynthesis
LKPQTTLTVLVPVYNEQYFVAESLRRLKVLAGSPLLKWVQVVVVDDASTDATPSVLQGFKKKEAKPSGRLRYEFYRQASNQGKGAAIKAALERARGEITIIHDADLEYHPEDILPMLKPFLQDQADAVFGSRFQAREYRRVLAYRHELGNRFLTFLSNLLTNYNLTDMETCYKAVRTSMLKSIPLESRDFRLEVELTHKLAKREARLYEVPISYSGRTYQDGKKINWKDGVKALTAILRFSVQDNIYSEDGFRSRMVARLSRAPRFNAWLASRLKPWLGQEILHVAAGTGSLALELTPRQAYAAAERNPQYLDRLRTLEFGRPYWQALALDPEKPLAPPLRGKFDTVLCVNDLERYADDAAALTGMALALKKGGRVILAVPRGPWLKGSLDAALGHRRRYTRSSLRTLCLKAGLEIESLSGFNRLGMPFWFLNSVVFRRRHFPLLQIAMLNLLSPILRRLDPFLPWPSQSWILVAKRP